MRRDLLRVGAVLALAGFVLGAAQLASGASSATVQVVASGLNNPRGIEIGPDGAVYIAEAGAAGTKMCQKGPEGEQCLGFTGSIDRVAGGTKSRYGAGFLSGGGRDGSFSVGMDDVAIAPDGTVYGIMSTPGLDPEHFGPQVAAQAGYVMRIDRGGKTAVGENVTKYEVGHNPAKDNVDSDPYGIAWSPLGLAVADAAGNSLLLLHPNGTLSCLMTFKAENFGGHYAQRVPTTVVWHDGAFYVGELGGGGTPNGQSHVWKVVPGQGKTMVATGLTAITGLAFGPDGSMYVSELTKHGLAAAEKGDLAGAIIRIWPDGHRTTIAPPELVAPAGIAVAGDNTIYVVTGSVFASKGKLLSITQ